MYFPSQWKSLIDDLEKTESILVSTFCMASMSCFSLVALELFGWDSLIPYMTTLNSLSVGRFNKTGGRSVNVIVITYWSFRSCDGEVSFY